MFKACYILRRCTDIGGYAYKWFRIWISHVRKQDFVNNGDESFGSRMCGDIGPVNLKCLRGVRRDKETRIDWCYKTTVMRS